MRVYLAGASSEADLVELYMDALRMAGHVVTRDWVAIVRGHGDANPRDVTEALRRGLAHGDLDGAANAQVFWLLVPEKASIGCWVELGYAFGMRREPGGPLDHGVIVVSGDVHKTIFTAMCDRQFRSHDSALEWILGLAENASARFVSG